MKKCIFTALAACTLLQAVNNVAAEGNSFGSKLGNYFKSNKDSAINSLTNSGELSTVDGKKKANVKMSCEESRSGEFLNIDYLGTSDIDIRIKLDKNVDGKVDKIWSFYGISGICTEGLVKCDRNTWNNCEYFSYNYGQDIKLVKTTMNNLSGCYCINSSCGFMAAKNKDKILLDIAGAVYSTLATKTGLILSKATKVKGALSYRGQDYSVCDSYGKAKDVNPSSDLEDMARKEIRGGNSAYSTLEQGLDNKAPKDSTFENKLYRDTVSIDSTTRYSRGHSKIDFSYTDTTSSKRVSGNFQTAPDVRAKFCEVKVLKEDSSAFNDGTNRANSTNNTLVYQSEIRECTNNWSKCPINEKNETLKHNCGRINDMGEALAQLSVLDEVSRDMVCSK